MKGFAVLLALGMIAASSAEAREFYSVPLTVSVYYKNVNHSLKRVGAIRGVLQTSPYSLDYTKLVLNGHEVPFELDGFSVHRRIECDYCGPTGPYRPEVSLTFDYDTLKKLALEANHSWYRSPKTRKHVADLIGRTMARYSGPVTIQATYTINDYIPDSDGTVTVLGFDDDHSPESLEIVFDIGNRVKVR